jgi:branched-chain amino acid aminotransferase
MGLVQRVAVPHNARMAEPIAYLNGQWIPASSAAVPVSDAGFVLGVTVAEQLRTFAGRLFRLGDHLARLAHSLDIVGLEPGVTSEHLAALAQEIVVRNHPLVPSGDDLGLSIFVTPGDYPAYATREKATALRPTLCLHTYNLPFHRWAAKYRHGQALVTTDVQQVSPRCWPPDLKCRSRMHYYLADRQAAAVDPQARALLLDTDGFVTEASTANLLIYREAEALVSPPATRILHGISLAAVCRLAAQLGVPCAQRDLTVNDVIGADEVFLSSTPMCLLPVTGLNGRSIGSGRPGPMFERLIGAWSQRVGVDIVGQAERFAGIPRR